MMGCLSCLGEIEDDEISHYSEVNSNTNSEDESDVQARPKHSEEILSLRAENNMFCRQFLVKETHKLIRSEDDNGNKMINEYVRVHRIGSGSYGKVSHLRKIRVALSETAMTDVLREFISADSIWKLLIYPQPPFRHRQALCTITAVISLSRSSLVSPLTALSLSITTVLFRHCFPITDAFSLPPPAHSLSSVTTTLSPVTTTLSLFSHRCSISISLYLVRFFSIYARSYLQVLEYVEGKWICEGSGRSCALGEETALIYLRDIVSGLKYLHAHNIVHGDIKPDNLLVNRHGTVKIGDFSVSQAFEDDNDVLRLSLGTPVFTAPECCLGYGLTYHDKTSDTWAVGVTLFCDIGRPPLPFLEFREQTMVNEDAPDVQGWREKMDDGTVPSFGAIPSELFPYGIVDPVYSRNYGKPAHKHISREQFYEEEKAREEREEKARKEREEARRKAAEEARYGGDEPLTAKDIEEAFFHMPQDWEIAIFDVADRFYKAMLDGTLMEINLLKFDGRNFI
ncbi:hypothetical protein RIF29_24439 [Crotalaria pallida]|uniref:Protein kinase domain-containing protein n=1 Tax=Crotalaria pallida TaxID=3830 RepID=A0AAN9I387_CROPI